MKTFFTTANFANGVAKRAVSFLCLAVIAVALSGCMVAGDRNAVIPEPRDESDPVLALRVGVASVAPLRKGAAITLDRIEIVFSSSANDTVRDTLTSSTTPALDPSTGAPQVLAKNYDLMPLRSWKMVVSSRDVNDSLVHRDSATIPVLYAGDTASVSLNLAARYALYEARFLSLPDSIASSTPSQPKQVLRINRLVLRVDGVAVRDSAATPGPWFAAGATHTLAFDYIAAGTGSWTTVASGTSKGLHAVQFPATDTGYIVGDTVMLRTVNGGATWSALTGAAPRSLRYLSFVNATTGVTGGDSATSGRTSDAGANWALQKISGFTNVAAPVAMVNDTGFSLTNATTPGGSSTYRRTTNGGATWSITAGYANNIHAMTCVSTSACWAAGYLGTIRKSTSEAGTFSTLQTSGTTRTLRGLYFHDANLGWAVGDTGTILKTTNGGTTWSAQTSGTTHGLRAVHFLDTSIGYAAGHNGTILATNNGGATWSTQNSGVTTSLGGLAFSGATGFAVGDGGVILKLNDIRKVELEAYGPMGNWDTALPLYTGLRYINVLSGTDATIPLTLRWTGPTSGTGALDAEISKVGKVTVNGDLPDAVIP